MVELALRLYAAGAIGLVIGVVVPRPRDRRIGWRLLGLVGLVVLACRFWTVLPPYRPFLFSITPIGATLGALRFRLTTLRDGLVLMVLALPALLLITRIAIAVPVLDFITLTESRLLSISPDSRWEVHLVEHGGIAYCVDELVLAPHVPATLNPFAAHPRSLGEMAIEGDLDHVTWDDPTTLVLHVHPHCPDPPYLLPNPNLRMRVVNMTPPPQE